jgi:hypothetical protein
MSDRTHPTCCRDLTKPHTNPPKSESESVRTETCAVTPLLMESVCNDTSSKINEIPNTIGFGMTALGGEGLAGQGEAHALRV